LSICLRTAISAIVDDPLFPSEPTLFPSRVRSLSLMNSGVLLFILPQSNHLCHLAFTLASRAFISFFNQNWSKMAYFVFKSLRSVELKTSLSSLRTKKLKYGICHTPFLTYYSSFKPGFFVVSDEISTERYFKIPHLGFRKRQFFSFIIIYFFFYFLFYLFILFYSAFYYFLF